MCNSRLKNPVGHRESRATLIVFAVIDVVIVIAMLGLSLYYVFR